MGSQPRAVIFGLAGPFLDSAERSFFAAADPLGFILFARNCDSPEQIAALTGELRRCVRRADVPVLIDQEGGRVQRLKAPQWRAAPPAGRFGTLHERDAAAAIEAHRQLARRRQRDPRRSQAPESPRAQPARARRNA